MRKITISFLGFIIVVLGVFGVISFFAQLPSTVVDGENGVADLRQVDFERMVSKASGWNYYPGQLAGPEQLGDPALQPGEYQEDASVGTFALKLAMPDAQEYVLAFNSIEFSTKVFIGGKAVDEIGQVTATAAGFEPVRKYCYFMVVPEQGEVDIVLQYANFYTGYGKAPAVTIGRPELMFREQIHSDFSRFTIMALYLAAFILFAGMYLFNRKRRENFYFSLLCLLLTVRECFVEEQFLFMLLPDVPLRVIFTVQYVFIGLLVMLWFEFIITLFERIISRKEAIAFRIACGLFLIASVITRGNVPYAVTCGFLLIGVYMILHLLVGMIKMRKKLTPSQQISAVGLLILYGSLFNDMLHHLRLPIGIIGRRGLLQNSMIIFIFIQMAALFLQFVWIERQLGETREKEAVLAARNETLKMVDRQRVRFLSDISHELKTPLTVLSNYAQLTYQHALQEIPEDHYTTEKMLLVTSEAKRMAAMVEQVLDIARIEEGRLTYEQEDVYVDAVIQELIEVYYPVLNKNHNRLELSLPERLPVIRGDSKRIQQVFLNLINNAVRFTKNGLIRVAVSAAGSNVTVTVQDTGIGMSEAQMKAIFERYTTSKDADDKRTGTGLGLYIVKAIVSAHRGEVRVESSAGKGSIFTVILPGSQKEDEE